MKRVYMCIDLKSFYASVECVERKLDPLKTNLVVADSSRTEKTICLAVSPSLKEYGIGGRARLYEVVQKVKEVNNVRKRKIKGKFVGKSYDADVLNNNPNVELDYIVAKPRMYKYMKYSTDIYNIYLKYLAPEDIYVYSIDEVFCDITNYLRMYKKKPRDIVTMIIKDVYDTTGITATAGIGTNLYLAKIALDIISKHVESNIGYLDEELFKKYLWNYTPLTDFWSIGPGISNRLNNLGIFTMEDISKCEEAILFKEFGINARLLIDHSNGIETTTMKDIKSYKPKSKSLSSSQILFSDYNYSKARLVLIEMIDDLVLEMSSKELFCNGIHLYIGYSKDAIKGLSISKKLDNVTCSYDEILKEYLNLYDKNINKIIPIRRIGISFSISNSNVVQLDLFNDFDKKKNEMNLLNKISNIKNKFGPNKILRGVSLEDGATQKMRNSLVGGHNAE